jgi:L-lactate dehydrogenase complex protein LldF
VTTIGGLAERAHEALGHDQERAAVRQGTGVMAAGRLAALAGLTNPDELRDAARTLRTEAIAALPELLEEWSDRLTAAGGKVFWARDAKEACDYVVKVAEERKARLVAKSKSMASEEIHLNAALEAVGVEVVETDLGEFIIQVAGEAPFHIITPSIHKDRVQVAEILGRDAGRQIEPEIPAEVAYARERLRDVFLKADIGVSGVNFAVASTGSICIVTNEGNGRMVTSLPRVHVAIMGMERIVRDLSELDVMLSLLARSATGQQLTVYTNLITGPARAGEVDGPEELHVVVLDNGRSNVLASEFREALNCIRCGACLNVCPVYRHVGGHSYGSVYPGPIGAVLTPLLKPDDPQARELSTASSLCGACVDVCPVRIPLVDMLLDLRARDHADLGLSTRAGFAAWSRAWSRPAGLRATRWLLRAGNPLAQRLRGGPGWMGAWLRFRRPPH